MKRRTLLTAIGTTTFTATAGCISVDVGGTMDVVVSNCLEGDQTNGDADEIADVRIRRDRNGNVVLDETVTVPERSCSDVVDGVERNDVFPEAGSYTVSVTVEGYDRSEVQVEFTPGDVEDDTDNVDITIREETIEIE